MIPRDSLAVDAFVFDAYGTLFDVQSVFALAESLAPGRGAAIAQLWRAKQLEYTWWSSLMASERYRREDFAELTARALDYALDALGIEMAGPRRTLLASAYLALARLPMWPARSRRSRRGHAGSCPTARARCSIRSCARPGSPNISMA